MKKPVWTQDIVVTKKNHKRQYHVRIALTKVRMNFYFPLDEEDNENLERVGFPTDKMVEDLGDLSGTESVFLGRYWLEVEIGQAFSWNEVHPQIIKVIKKHFGLALEINALSSQKRIWHKGQISYRP